MIERASREVTVLLRVFRCGPYRLFGSPVPPQCFELSLITLGAFRPTSSPQSKCQGVYPLSSFGSPSETLAPVALEPKFELPPVGFFAPTAFPRSMSRRYCSGSTRSAIPPWSFSDLRGFDPHRTWWPCFMPHPLLGLCSPRLFPSADSIGLVTRWYPLDVSR